MKPGILYLIPASLASPKAKAAHLDHVIPAEVKTVTAGLAYFIAENAKSARAHLTEVSRTCELKWPLQKIRFAELNVKRGKDALLALLEPILAGTDGGLISQAGVPVVADPGSELIQMAHDLGITVIPLVGPSSILLALMGSGLGGQNFSFNGYLPIRPADRARQIRFFESRSRAEKQTQIFIETPYRNQALLEALCEGLRDNTRLCVATDLTLPTESIRTQLASQWKDELAQKKTPDILARPSIFLFSAAQKKS